MNFRNMMSCPSRAAVIKAACLIVGLSATQWCGAQTLQTVISNGPTANRVNIVFASEGYTPPQLASFTNDAAALAQALFTHSPFLDYSNFFNVFAISVASSQSGSDHPANGSYVNTYFNSFYAANNPILVDIDSTGQTRLTNLLKSLLPECDLPVVLVNDRQPGGSEGGQKAAIVALGTLADTSAELLAHESAHVLAGLGDEYDTAFAYPDVEEPNTTRETRREFIKWKHWIADTTPVPTPPYLQYEQVVGLFEGAHYHELGWYRPKLTCAMRDRGSPFCEVCQEALLLDFHKRTRPIDTFSPTPTNLVVSTSGILNFAVQLQSPSHHSLNVQWWTNGVAVPGASSVALSISTEKLRGGTNTVIAKVVDLTSFVRYDPANLLVQVVNWNVAVNIPKLEFDSPLILAGSKFAFRARGYARNGYVLRSSSNLVDWLSRSTNYLTNGEAWHTNVRAAGTELYNGMVRP